MTNDRLLLWIDGVGGYLVCLKSRISLGRAQPGTNVDVPVLADISRLHAELHRDAEGYVIEAHKPVCVNGKALNRGPLQDGDRVTLGNSLQLLFRLPVPLSGSARLDIVSGHRLPTAVDGVLLMADTLVLGPSSQSHVQAPDTKREVVLCRGKNSIGVRYAGEFRVGDQPHTNRAALSLPTTVCTDDIVFSLEPRTIP
jgi:hypothetical protein